MRGIMVQSLVTRGIPFEVALETANSVREEGLLAIATSGVVFSPGSAGTIQEVFQDAAQNHYRSFGHPAPMIFLGVEHWRIQKPVYPLLTQLAGRAGRGDRPGKVVIQSYHPGHYAIQAALANDDAAFAEAEMRFRRIFHYPPYARMVQLLLQDTDRGRGEASLAEIAARLRGHRLADGVRILGPAPAPFERLRGRWRFQVLLRGPSGNRLRELIREVVPPPSPPELTVDVDPYDLL